MNDNISCEEEDGLSWKDWIVKNFFETWSNFYVVEPGTRVKNKAISVPKNKLNLRAKLCRS